MRQKLHLATKMLISIAYGNFGTINVTVSLFTSIKNMFKRLLVLSFIIAGILYLCQCKKTTTPVVIYKGVVLYNICGNVVIQSQGAQLLGENGWTDSNNPSRPIYDHVFRVANACEFGNYSQGDTIQFAITNLKAQQCAQCLLYVATPTTAIPVRVIR